ncbi:MAG: hypothetical protein LIR50_09600 [Bacillota bacterium]|nr:hypothetical protein [Bacillota bacterium]
MRKKYLTVILIIFIFCFTGCMKSSSNIENYLNSGTSIDSKAKDIMPSLDDLPKNQSIAYKYTHKSFIFESDSVALIVNYDDETFKSEKDKLTKKYTYLDKNVISSFDESKYYIPEYEFSINSYTFNVIAEDGKHNMQYPHSFGMIGTSDKKKSIAYLYFYDTDLDYIGEKNVKHPMADFVKEYFDYNF